MKIRTLPYGYKYENGKIAVEEREAAIVTEVFERYKNGESLLNIAENLNFRKIEYVPGTTGWNKSRIKRIIEEKRYLGKSDYPILINEKIHELCVQIKDDRNNQKEINRQATIYHIHAPVICPNCNERMRRRKSQKTSVAAKWYCQNPNCTTALLKNDDEFLREIHCLLNTVIQNPSLIEVASKNKGMEERLKESIMQYAATSDISMDTGKNEMMQRLLRYAAEQYKGIEDADCRSLFLQDAFREDTVVDDFPLELFNRTVSAIRFREDQTMSIVLLNGQIIG